jgi:hypothetical protein
MRRESALLTVDRALRDAEPAYTPPVAGSRGDTLLQMMRFMEMFTLDRAWSDLGDGEFFWEPVPGSWSVRQRDECRTANPFGTGDWVVDFDYGLAGAAGNDEAVAPLTTIAWLFWHVGSMAGRAADLDFLGGTKAADSGWTSPYLADHPVFSSSSSAVEAMRKGWRALERAMHASTDDGLNQATRFWGYPGFPGPPAQGYLIIASVLNEISHHGTQVCMLRDLYRAVDGRSLG